MFKKPLPLKTTLKVLSEVKPAGINLKETVRFLYTTLTKTYTAL